MPEETPIPLQDRSTLENTFNSYTPNSGEIDVPQLPYRNPEISVPLLGGGVGGNRKLSALEKWNLSLTDSSDGRLSGGGKNMSFDELTNTRFSSYDPTQGVDNEDAFARSQSFWDKGGNGLIKMLGTATTTAISSTLGAINGAIQWADTGKFSSFYDNEFTHALDDQMKLLEETFPHYSTAQQRADDWYEPSNLFSGNFVFDKVVKNLGFSLGAALPALAVGKALNALSLSSRLFAAGEAIAVTEAIEAASVLPRIQQLASIENKLQTIINSGRNIAGGALKGLGAAKVGGVEQGGALTKFIASGLSSSGEASLEAFHNLNEYRNTKISEFEKANGYKPTGKDLEEINLSAESVGNASYGLNAALLTGTQYIQLNKIFGSTFKGERSLLNRTIQNPTGALEVAQRTGLNRAFFKGRNLASLGFNEAEAFEEGAQFAVQTGTKHYYDKKYRGEGTDFLSSLGYGIGQALTTSEGLENVFLGGFSGALMTSGFISTKGIGKTGKIGERGWTGEGGQRATNTSQFVNDINNTRFGKYLKDGVDQANRALTIQEQREEAIRRGDVLESKELEQEFAHNYLSHRIKWDRFDLVQSDINDLRQTASTPQGFSQLQQEGKAAETDTVQTFLKRLNNFETTAKFVKEQYDNLNLKYSGLVKPDGSRMYTPEVIDKMIYAAAKIKDYDQRIPELASDLLSNGIQVQDVVAESLTDEGVQKFQAFEDIKKLNTTDEVKEDLNLKLKDVVELTKRRKQFIDEYNDMKSSPSKHEVTAETITKTNTPLPTKIKIKTKTGEEELEVGTEYFLGKVTENDKNGKEVYRFPKLTIIGENADGTLKIKDSNGKIRDISKDVLADYQLGRVSDTLNNKKAKFFLENINTIFEFNFGKGKKKQGRLQYSSKDKILNFVYKDDKGKVRSIEVTGEQFVPQGNYNQPMIKAIGTLSVEAQKSLEDYAKEKDARTSAKRGNRLKVITEVFDETSAKLEKTKSLLQQKYSELEKIVNDLQGYENKIKAGELTKKNNFKSTTNRAIKAANKLSRMQEQLRLEIQELEAEQEQLEFNEAYIADMAQNIDELPTDSKEFLEELNDQVADLLILHETTGKQINALSKLIDNVEKALQTAIDFIKDILGVFETKYPKVPTNLDTEWVDFLKNNPNFLKLKPNYREDLKQVEELVAQVEDLDINPNERTVKELRTELEGLQSDITNIEKELVAKEVILNKFLGVVETFKKEEAKKKEFLANKEIQQKYFVQQQANEQKAGVPTEEWDGVFTPPVKDVTFAFVSSTDPAWEDETADDNFHRRHQTFLFNATYNDPKVFSQEEFKGKKAKHRIKILPITSVSMEGLGFPKDWILDQFKFNGTNHNEAAIRYVYVIEEDSKLFYVDVNGNKLSEVGKLATNEKLDTTKLVYTNAETSRTTNDFTNKDKLDEPALIKHWGEIRKQLFTINSANIGNYPQSFDVSKGMPNKTKDVNRSTTLIDAKVITENDLNGNVVIEVPTASSRFKAGIPILNYNGNTLFLNNRNFIKEEASNIVDVLIYAASSKEGLTNEIFNYLRNVLYFSTSIKEGQTIKRNQIFLKKGEEDNPVLVIGSNEQVIPFIGMRTEDGNNLLDKREELIRVIEQMYHHINNTSLIALKNKPNTPFTELEVKDGVLSTKKEWASYQHYLLTPANAPLTANINIPQEGEIPIKEKYAIVRYETYNASAFKPVAPASAPTTNPPKVETSSFIANNLKITANITRDTTGKVVKATITSMVAQTDSIQEGVNGEEIKFEKGKDYKEGFEDQLASIEANMVAGLNDQAPKAVTEVVVKNFTDGNGTTWKFSTTITKNDKGEAVSGVVTSVVDIANPDLERIADYKDYLPQMQDSVVKAFNVDLVNAQLQAEKNTPPVSNEDINSMLDDAEGGYIDEDQNRTTFFGDKYTGSKEQETKDIAFMLPNVKVEMVNNLIEMSGGGQAWGSARSAMMEIYKDAPFGTKYHEAFEQIFNWVLRPANQTALFEEFKNRTGSFITFKGETKLFSEATFKEAKEQMAEEFIEYKQRTVSPKSSKIAQFFKDLWNLIKGLLTSKPETLASVFDKLNRGAYRKAPMRTALNIEYREKNVQGEAISFVNTVLAGMTADIFITKWKSDVSLIMDLEERDTEPSKELFDGLLGRLTEYFENNKSQSSVYAFFKDKLKSKTTPAEQKEVRDEFDALQAAWKRVKGQWGNYTEDLKSFLKVFDIAFQVDEEGNLELASNLDSTDEKTQLSMYNDDKMSINAKNSASKVVKLLIATIADSEFVKKTVFDSLQTRNVDLAQTRPIRENVMRMRMLAPYAKLFNYILYNTANIPGIYNIFNKLNDLSSNSNLKQNANVKSLLSRLNYNKEKGFQGLSIPQIKLLLKFENALSKNKPVFVRQELNEDGKTVFKYSNIYDRISQLQEQWSNGLKALKFTTVQGDNIQFFKGIIASDPYLFLQNLNIPITRGSFPLDKEKELLSQIDVIKKFVTDHIETPFTITTKGKTIGIDSRIKTLAKFYVENIEGESTESQHINMGGKVTSNFVLPNFVSHLLSDANIASTLEEYKRLNPQYADLYMGDSYILNNILYKDGKKNKTVNVVVVEGKNIYSDNRATDKMGEGERILYEINNNLNGIYYTLMPADSKTEYGLDLGNVVPETFFNSQNKAKDVQDYVDKMYSSYLNEIALAGDYENRKNITALNRVVDGEAIGKQLRFFKYILNNPKTTLSKEAFKESLLKYIEAQAVKNIEELKSWRLIKDNTIYGLDSNFVARVFNKNSREPNFTKEQALELFRYREMNYVFSNIEMHKFIFNDPAQYKDELKRTKAFMSGREYTHVDTLQDERGLNDALKNTLNQGLTPTDIGWTNFKNHINSVTIKEIKTVSKYFGDITKILGDKAKKYAKMEIADAQSWAIGNTYREILYKSGGRFTVQQEELHQWLMAWERRDKNKYSSEVLRKADEKLLESPIPSTDKHIMYILKPIVSGTKLVEGEAVQYLYKTSTAPLYYYFIKGTPLEQVYNKMQEKDIDFLAMESASAVSKAGVLTDNTISMFDNSGNVSSEFNNVNPFQIDYKYFGIQVDTAAQKEKQTQGSQLTKLAVLDLMSNGIPIDFINALQKTNPKVTQEEVEQAWENSDKSSPILDLVEEHKDVLIALAIKRTQKVFDKLGIKKEDFGYSYRDKAIVARFILKELERRELPENIKHGVEVKYNAETDSKEFVSPLEANVNYLKIKQILWSVIEKGVTRPTMSGGPKVQMSVAGMGNIREVEVNGKKVLVDDTLKFYSQNENGITDACEVDLPFFFKDKLYNSPKFKGMPQEEVHDAVLKYLNSTEEGQSLLRGIGFRIPTQGLNSIEYFKVRKFLAPQLGDVIVLPAEITTKAGSDFDVDKLSLYLKNWYVGKSGFPKAVKFRKINSNNEQELTDLYEYTLKNKRKAWEELESVNKLVNSIFKDGEEPEYVPSLEEFLKESKGKTSLQLNTIEALENKYYETLEKLISLPENYKALISPNDASQLDNLSQEIQRLTNNVDVDINPGHLIDSNFMAKKRNTLLASKGSVGVAAVSNINLAINQSHNITLSISSYFQRRNVKIRLPYNTSKGQISLSGVTTKSGDNISNIGSQMIDGSVDAAKKEWLARMGFNDKMISTALLMNKWGSPIRNIAFFLNQPIIRTYMKEKEINEVMSKYNRNMVVVDAAKLQQNVSAIYSNQNIWGLTKSKPDEYQMSTKDNLGLEQMIDKDQNTLTKQQSARQLQILDDFLAYQSMAWELFRVVQGSNYDTARITSPEDMYKKELDEEKAEDSMVSSLHRIMSDSYFGTVASMVKNLNEALKTLLNTQTGKAEGIIRRMAYDLKRQKGLGDKDTYSKYMNKAEASMIDYIVQNGATIEALPLNEYTKGLLSSNQATARYIDQLKKDIHTQEDHPLKNNTFLTNLSTDIDLTNKKPSTVTIAEPDFDTFTSDSYTDQFRELLDSAAVVTLPGVANSQKLVSNVFQNLIVAHILQNGSSRKQGSFFHLIPNEIYSQYATPALNNIAEDLEAFYDNGMFYRNNARDTRLVPILRPDYWTDYDELVFSKTQIGTKDIIFVLAKNNQTYPFTKTYDRKTGETKLFKRVDSFDDKGRKSPAIIEKWTDPNDPDDRSKTKYVAYQEVNILSNEYKSLHSIFNPIIPELKDDFIIKELEKQGQTISYKNLEILTESEEIDLSLDMQLDLFPKQTINQSKVETKPLVDKSKKINIYFGTDENVELSNFASRPFVLGDGVTYPTVEHAFQMQKLEDSRKAYTTEQKEVIFNKMLKMTASEVKSFGKTIKGLDIKGWNTYSSDMMKDFIKQSFEANPKALQTLLATGNAQLTHTQDKGKWGTEFPKLLMEVREELRPKEVKVKETKEQTFKSFEDFKNNLKRKDCGM